MWKQKIKFSFFPPLYGTPVLMFGLASLVMSQKEIVCIYHQYKRTLQNILKLSTRSPASVVHFLAGSLPGAAILHLKQLSLFGMICRLSGDPLNNYAYHVLLTSPVKKSWFHQIRNLHLQYLLPHPLQVLQNPPSKEAYKKLVKARVLDYWETKLRQEASFLPSLGYFNPNYMSLTTPHKLWSAAGSKTYEVAKARIQALFLASQYPCAKYTRHWSPQNPNGFCSYPCCESNFCVESPEHILLFCPAYDEVRRTLVAMCLQIQNPVSRNRVINIVFSTSTHNIMQFLLDCSVMPDIISAVQCFGRSILSDLFYLGRSWCFSLHRERMKRLGRWNFTV